MFATLKNQLKDVGTLSALCKDAERIARLNGSKLPGSEHFLLAALDLQDGTARRALDGLGASPEAFAVAIRAQFNNALRHVGMESAANADPGLTSIPRVANAPKLYQAAASGQTMVQRLSAATSTRKARSLLGADVLLAVAEEEFSIAARALRALGITREQLIQAAGREIALHEKT